MTVQRPPQTTTPEQENSPRIQFNQSYQTGPLPPPNSINLKNIGYFLDGWADLIEGMGDKVETVRANIVNELQRRNMPRIQISETTGYVSLTSSDRRSYTITTTSPGATTAIYIGPHGSDLYASWRTFIRPVLNWNVILVALGICAVISLITSGGRFFGWFTSTIVLSILAGLLLGVAGRIFRGDFFGFFFIQPSLFDADDITAMSFSAHKSILRALDGAGIDVSKLRLKRDFKGGRRDEVV